MHKAHIAEHTVGPRRIGVANRHHPFWGYRRRLDQGLNFWRQPAGGDWIDGIAFRAVRRFDISGAGLSPADSKGDIAIDDGEAVGGLVRPFNDVMGPLRRLRAVISSGVEPRRLGAAVVGADPDQPVSQLGLDAVLAEPQKTIALGPDYLASERSILVYPDQRFENGRGILISDGYPGRLQRLRDRGRCISDDREIERHRFDKRHAEALVFAQRNVGVSCSVPAKKLLIGHRTGDFDGLAERRSTNKLIQVRFISAPFVKLANQDEAQRNAGNRPNFINEFDQLVLTLVRHPPTDKQKPNDCRLVIVRRLRVWRISNRGEIFKQRDNGYVAEASAAQLSRIE